MLKYRAFNYCSLCLSPEPSKNSMLHDTNPSCLSRPSLSGAIEPADTGLIRIFNHLFQEQLETVLVGGGSEPVYLPKNTAQGRRYHEVIFRLDYPSSALHEAAHWCIAGDERRLLEDYGYWYAPDGRTEQQQKAFEQVEVLPQAIEWVFSRAAGLKFQISADNLEAGGGPSNAFVEAVYQRVISLCEQGLPDRAARYASALAVDFERPRYLDKASYCLSDIA